MCRYDSEAESTTGGVAGPVARPAVFRVTTPGMHCHHHCIFVLFVWIK
jgi:hypothetical protein